MINPLFVFAVERPSRFDTAEAESLAALSQRPGEFKLLNSRLMPLVQAQLMA